MLAVILTCVFTAIILTLCSTLELSKVNLLIFDVVSV